MVEFFLACNLQCHIERMFMQRQLLAALATAIVLGASPVTLAADEAKLTFAEMSLKERQEALLGSFLTANQGALDAEARVMLAVGMKPEADKNLAQALALVPEVTSGQMEETLQSRTAANAALANKLSVGGLTLNDAQKNEVTLGIEGMALSVKQFGDMMTDFPELKKALRDGGLKRKKALYASRFLPQSLADSKQSLAATVAFARANNIPFSPAAGELAK